MSETLVASVLQELCEKDLLEAGPEFIKSTVPAVSRRQAIGRAARYGAAAAAGSMIISATAATPAMDSSGEALTCYQCYSRVRYLVARRMRLGALIFLGRKVDEAGNCHWSGARGFSGYDRGPRRTSMPCAKRVEYGHTVEP